MLLRKLLSKVGVLFVASVICVSFYWFNRFKMDILKKLIPTKSRLVNDVNDVNSVVQQGTSYWPCFGDCLNQPKDSPSRCRRVSIKHGGRLGNAMFAYASLLGIANKLGATPILADRDIFLRDVFQIVATPGSKCAERNPKKLTLSANVSNANNLDSILMDVSPNVDVHLIGHFHSWKYFHHIEKILKEEFRFHQDVQSKANKFITDAVFKAYGDSVKPTHCVIIGVHVRRNDLAKGNMLARGFVTADKDYIDNAIIFFEKRFSTLPRLFVVCADDKVWARRNVLRRKSPIVFSDETDPIVDLAILVNSNHTIMTVGTFGFWAAYLAPGIKVYFKDFFKPGSKLDSDSHFGAKDRFPSSWVAL